MTGAAILALLVEEEGGTLGRGTDGIDVATGGKDEAGGLGASSSP